MPSSFLFRTNQGKLQYGNSNYILPPAPVTINSVISGSTGTGLIAGNITNDVVSGTATTNNVTYNVYSFQPSNSQLPSASSSSQSTYTINYKCNAATTIYVLAVGGGGSGGPVNGGGGGAGGVVMNPVSLPAGTSTINVFVGAGGNGTIYSSTNIGLNGSNSAVNFIANSSANIIAYGGGAGGGYNATVFAALTGGSSGGGSPYSANSVLPNTQYINFANQGGFSNGTNGGGAGGGGAGTAGTNSGYIGGNTYIGGNGGNGIQCFLPGIKDFVNSGNTYGNYYWGGGGGGAGAADNGTGGNGGLGGGGGGAAYQQVTVGGKGGVSGINIGGSPSTGATSTLTNSTVNGGNGGVNTGSGGGGVWYSSTSGSGGSGVVVIAFPSSSSILYNSAAVLPASIYSSNLYNATLNNSALSQAVYSSIKGAYGCRLLNYNYFGPTITLRHTMDISGQYTQNFYSDICGNLGTGYLGTGQSIADWLSRYSANKTYAFVSKWYDQGSSSTFNNASQYTIASQPVYDVSNGIINFNYAIAGDWVTTSQTTCYFNLPDGALPYNDSNYTYTFKHLNVKTGTKSTFFSGGAAGANLALRIYESSDPPHYLSYMFNAYYGVANVNVSPNNTVTFTYSNSPTKQQSLYLNSATTANETITVPSAYTTNNTNNTMGVGVSTEYLNGQLYYMYVFNSVLSTQDRNSIESTSSSKPSPIMIITISTFINLGSFTPTFSYAGASYYIMYINGNYYGPVTSGNAVPYLSKTANVDVTIYAYTSSSNLILLAVGYSNVIYPVIYFRFLPGDITGNTLINYGIAGNGSLSSYNSSYNPTISTTSYPTGKASSGQFTSISYNYAYWGYSSAYLGGNVTPPSYNWGVVKSAPSGITMSMWYYYNGTGDPGPWNIGNGYSQVTLTYGYNIGISGSGTYTYNSTTYNNYTGIGLFCNTYPNGQNSGLLKFFGFAYVPLFASNTWNHLALTVSASYTNPVWTLYFNGTPYVLGSSTFAVIGGASTIGYPYGTDGINNYGIYNWATSDPIYNWTPPSFIKNYGLFNTCLTSAQITTLMNQV